MQVARQVRLRIRERTEVRVVNRRIQAAQQVTIGDIEGRGSEFDDVLLALTEVEVLADGDVLAQLIRLIQLRNHRGHVAVGEVGRLDEGGPVQIGAVRIRRVQVGVQQRLARNIAATGRTGARQGLAATADADGRTALITVDRRNAPVADDGVQHRVHVGAERPCPCRTAVRTRSPA